MPRPAIRYIPPARPAPPPAVVGSATSLGPHDSAPASLHQISPEHLLVPSNHRRPPRRRRDELSDDDDDQSGKVEHVRKWIRTARTTPNDPSAAESSPTLPYSPVDTPDSTSEPVAADVNVAMPDTSSRPVYACSAPNCPLPVTAVFPSLSAIESHIRKHHHHICRSARPHSHTRCNAVFPSNHLLDIHLQEAHSPLFWAQFARGDAGLFACFLTGCRVKVDGLGERRDHMLAVHRWPADKYDHVQRQVGRGASKYFKEEENAGNDGGMQVDQVVSAFMDLDTS